MYFSLFHTYNLIFTNLAWFNTLHVRFKFPVISLHFLSSFYRWKWSIIFFSHLLLRIFPFLVLHQNFFFNLENAVTAISLQTHLSCKHLKNKTNKQQLRVEICWAALNFAFPYMLTPLLLCWRLKYHRDEKRIWCWCNPHHGMTLLSYYWACTGCSVQDKIPGCNKQ